MIEEIDEEFSNLCPFTIDMLCEIKARSALVAVAVAAAFWFMINGGKTVDAPTLKVAVPTPDGNDFPWQSRAEVNSPGEFALSGAGFNIQLFSNGCGPVARTEDPDDFVGVGNGKDQDSNNQGNITVCNDCITQTCNELIP